MKRWIVWSVVAIGLSLSLAACAAKSPTRESEQGIETPIVQTATPATVPTQDSAPSDIPSQGSGDMGSAGEVIETRWYTITIPQSWQGKYTYEEWESTDPFDVYIHSLTFYEKDASKEARYRDTLFELALWGKDQYKNEYNSYKLSSLADVSMMDEGRPSFYVGDIVVVLSYTESCSETYMMLYDEIGTILDSFTPKDGYMSFPEDGDEVSTGLDDFNPRFGYSSFLEADDYYDDQDYADEDYYNEDYETASAVPDGTVAYFRFMYDVGKYEAANGQYILKSKWTWSENTEGLPQTAMFSVVLPQTISASNCPYTPCSEKVLDMSLGDAMFSSYDNLLQF